MIESALPSLPEASASEESSETSELELALRSRVIVARSLVPAALPPEMMEGGTRVVVPTMSSDEL